MNRYFATFHRRGSMTKNAKHGRFCGFKDMSHMCQLYLSLRSMVNIFFSTMHPYYVIWLYICPIYHSHNWSEAINKNKDNGVLVLILDSNDVDVGRLEGLPNFRTLLIIKGQRVSLQPVSFFWVVRDRATMTFESRNERWNTKIPWSHHGVYWN